MAKYIDLEAKVIVSSDAKTEPTKPQAVAEEVQE